MINGVIYARYSCEKQTENSILGQVRECTSFAEKNDIYITKVYKDEAISGRTANKRPAFMQMIKDGYAHLFDVVIVWKGDRFSRSRADAARYKGELKKLGIRVLSATEANVTGPEAILMDGINEAFAEYFSVELAAKVERGMTQNVIEGKFNGGRMPIGYKKDENGKIVIDENKAYIVRELFNNYVIGGQTVMDIYNSFKMKGYLDNNGKYIPHGTLQNMLNNPRYYGYYEFKGTVNMNVFPPIINEKTFKKAKERLTINHKTRGKFHAKEPFYFRHLMRCKYCNAEMHCEAGTSGTGNKYYYYRCSRAHEMEHPSVRYNKEEIEEIIFREIFNFFQDKDLGNMLVDDIIKSYKSVSSDTALKKKALAETMKKLENLVVVVEKAGNVEPFLKRIEELNEIKEKQELEVKKCEPVDLEQAKEDIREYFFFIKQYDAWNEETKKAFVEIFIDSVYVTEETIDIVFKFKNDIGLCVHHLELIVQSSKHLAHQLKNIELTLLYQFFLLTGQRLTVGR